MKRLKNIYYDFSNSKEYQALGEMPEAREAREEFYGLLEREQLSFNKELEIDMAHGKCIFSYEMQGFVYGFRYGIQLMAECMPKGGDSND